MVSLRLHVTEAVAAFPLAVIEADCNPTSSSAIGLICRSRGGGRSGQEAVSDGHVVTRNAVAGQQAHEFGVILNDPPGSGAQLREQLPLLRRADEGRHFIHPFPDAQRAFLEVHVYFSTLALSCIAARRIIPRSSARNSVRATSISPARNCFLASISIRLCILAPRLVKLRSETTLMDRVRAIAMPQVRKNCRPILRDCTQ